ncbi:TrbI/VirB10 family protein [Novosphingobium terrae]|uniref:TrbI/VirB10 family protein n=1 Tax=Novosphingobium terrae TaxID=2726189 RepID=UPI00197E5291|nr:TrbI/VirB10 family protein [Novosphingobium terrae]
MMSPTPLSARNDPRASLSDEDLAQAATHGFPVVASATRRSDRMGLLAGAAIALTLGAVTFLSLSRTPAPAAEPVHEAAEIATPAPVAAVPAIPAPTPTASPPPALTSAQQAALAKAGAGAGLPDHQASPVMVYDAPSDVLPPPAAKPATPGPASPAAPLAENDAFASRIAGGGVETASASRLANPASTLTQGTLIPAILETAIDSDLPGFVRAVVTQDIRSFDGSQVVVPRSSRLIGQYKSGLAAGQTRAYVMWSRLIRPDGVSVALGSPAVEFSGRSGLSGEVNGHFFKRFGAAAILSVLGGAGALVGSGTSVVIGSSGQSAASVAAQRDAQIPPTVRIRVGTPIRVFIARDLDFSTVEP